MITFLVASALIYVVAIPLVMWLLDGESAEKPRPVEGHDRGAASGGVADNAATSEWPSDTTRPEAAFASVSAPALVAHATSAAWFHQAEQMQLLRERLNCARAMSDRQLAKEAAAQVRQCAEGWCRELQSRVASDSSVATGVGPIEMGLAQLETTLSNIDSIDWHDELLGIMARLDREMVRLERVLNDLKRAENSARLQPA